MFDQLSIVVATDFLFRVFCTGMTEDGMQKSNKLERGSVLCLACGLLTGVADSTLCDSLAELIPAVFELYRFCVSSMMGGTQTPLDTLISSSRSILIQFLLAANLITAVSVLTSIV